MFGPYAQIYDAEQGPIYELPDVHTLDIDIFGPYGQIVYAQLVCFYKLPDIHTLDIGTVYHRELPVHAP
jgi:hypothetical protein